MKLLLVLLILIPFYIIGQEVQWGSRNESDNVKYEPNIKAWNNDGVYCFGDDGKINFFEKLDPKTFKSIYIKEFEEPDFGYKSTIEDVAFANGNFIVFLSYFNKDEKKMVIYAIEINGETGVKTGKKVKIFEAEVEKNKRKGHFVVIVSNDNSKILINHYALHKKENRMHDIYLLIDNEFNVITQRTEKFDLDDVDYKTSNYMIDNQGSIYFWKASKNGNSVISYDANKDYDKWEENISIDTKPNTYSVGGGIKFDKNDNLLIAGFYASKHPEGTKLKERYITKYEGIFFLKIDKNSKEIVVNTANEFSKEEKEKFKFYKKGYDKIPFNSFTLVPSDDGGAVLIGEKVFRVVIQQRNNTIVTNYFNDLAVARVDKQGEVKWAKRICKNQAHTYQLNLITAFWSIKRLTKGMECFSYLPQIKDDKLFIYYNDNPKNLELTKVEDKYAYIKQNANNAVSVKCEFDLEKGVFTKDMFKAISAQGLHFKPMFIM